MLQKATEELIYYIDQGGFIMYPLLVGTFMLWYALGYRMYVLRRGSTQTVRGLVERYSGGFDRLPRGIVDTAVVRGIQIASESRGNLRRILDDEYSELMREISKYSVLAGTIVLVAPLAGLLGTVTGMIEMFDSLAEQTFYSQSGGIARGIAQALFTTQLGLAVAVPGMIAGRVLDRKQNHIEHELRQLKDILCARAPLVASDPHNKKRGLA